MLKFQSAFREISTDHKKLSRYLLKDPNRQIMKLNRNKSVESRKGF